MQGAHQRSWQTCGVALAAIALTSCASDLAEESIWPPDDFALSIEEASIRDGDFTTERCFRVRADGLVSFATASGAVVDPETGTALPVWSRLAVYRLVPTCTRALARRVHRAGVLDLAGVQGQNEGDVAIGAVLRWRAFDRSVVATSRGRVHGPMAEILAVVAAHLPIGEQLLTPGIAERGVASVLRGVPTPRDDAEGAMAAHLRILEASPGSTVLLLDTFALACRLGRRQQAEELIDRWAEAAAATAVETAADVPSEIARLSPAILRRMLPPAVAPGQAGG